MSSAVVNTFQNQHCTCSITHESQYHVNVRGIIRDQVKGDKIEFVAAAPPDFRTSFTGSGLPFANSRIAFENTPTSGTAPLGADKTFLFKVQIPNSYYVGLGTVIIPPVVYLLYTTVDDKKVITHVPLSKGIPYRMLTYPMQYTKARKDVSFYAGGWELPVRTQEQVLRDSKYPCVNSMHDNFWGLKPRL
jgi:hypothetical protein